MLHWSLPFTTCLVFRHALENFFVRRDRARQDEVAEWLRRWTANPLCSARVGSNPILVGVQSFSFSLFERVTFATRVCSRECTNMSLVPPERDTPTKATRNFTRPLPCFLLYAFFPTPLQFFLITCFALERVFVWLTDHVVFIEMNWAY